MHLQKREIPCLGRGRTAVQNITPLALSSAKSVTVQTNKQTHTHTNSKRHPHLAYVWIIIITRISASAVSTVATFTSQLAS